MSVIYQLRWPTRIGSQLYPPFTIVEVLSGDDPRVQTVWPGIKHKPDSDHLAIIFGDLKHPFLVKRDQLIEVQLHACERCGAESEVKGVCADCMNDAQAT